MEKDMKTRFVMCALVLIICVPAISSTDWYDWLYGGELSVVHGNPVTDWYDISQWEVDVCFDWGGTEDPNQVSQNNVGGDYYHNLIVSLQAEVSDPLRRLDVGSEGMVYEVAWFIQPTRMDETMNFEVYMVDENRVRELVESSSSNFVNGFRGYHVAESSVNYTRATLRYWNENKEGELEVPFVR